MAKDRCCGVFHMTTGAALAGVLQAVIVILLLSTTGVLLERWHTWKSEYEVYPSQDVSYTSTSTSTSPTFTPVISPTPTTTQIVNQAALAAWPEDGRWRRDTGLSAFLEIHLAHHVALYSLWLVCLLFYALAFKSYRAAWVLPNLIMQVIGLGLIMILAGIVIAKLVVLSRQYDSMVEYPNRPWERDDINMRYAFYAILLGCLVIAWVAELVFIWVGVDFYRYLRDVHQSVHPAEPQGRGSYHKHTILREHHDDGKGIRHDVAAASIEQPVKVYTSGEVMA